MSLFNSQKTIGIFRGFSEGGFEFHADLVLPYRIEYQYFPMHGQFILVQLSDENEAVLGRITSLRSEGDLVAPEGEDYNLRVVLGGLSIPEDLKQRYLKYRVKVRLLGVIREDIHGKIHFVPSHRRLPHVGSPVAFPDDELLRFIAGHYDEGAELGFLAMGEFIWTGSSIDNKKIKIEKWMQTIEPQIIIKFPVKNLVSRRTFVFARAGFGKSNLIKLLFSELYKEETPTVMKRGNTSVPVGSLIFDRDGEYFWPDDKGRPGLADVPGLIDKLVVFTSRESPSSYYGSFLVGSVKLDLRRFSPSSVISIALSPERQEQQNIRKIKGLTQMKWIELIDLIYRERNSASVEKIKEILNLSEGSTEVEAIAARSNMTYIVSMLHDPHSRLLDSLMKALRDGKICILDISQMSGEAALIFSGLILQYIFDHNQSQFTSKTPKTIPVIAVLEEAQSVLGHSTSSASTPYLTWVKEGRKYDLGAVLITQQPSSIPEEILSQGDNWFIFHLLSAADLKSLNRANAHFSDDLLSSLLNEPLPGHCIFWSSVSGKPYPLPVLILSFENLYEPLDPNYDRQPINTYAKSLRDAFKKTDLTEDIDSEYSIKNLEFQKNEEDYISISYKMSFTRVLHDPEFRQCVTTYKAIPWGKLTSLIEKHLADIEPRLHNTGQIAYKLVRGFMEQNFGQEGKGWFTERREVKKGEKDICFIVFSEESINKLDIK